MNLINFSLLQTYNDEDFQQDDQLNKINEVVDWKGFLPELEKLYANKNGVGGRPNYDPILMLKILFLAAIYNLTDKQAAYWIRDRISFRHFLGYPDELPDEKTLWVFRDRLANTHLDKKFQGEIVNQIQNHGFKISNGIAQDATFIDADPGHKKVNTPRGDEAKTRRSRDGTFAKKYNRTHFGFKAHTAVETNNTFIIRTDVTTAKVHDSRIDLSTEGEVVYRDKGYAGTEPNAHDATMAKGARGRKLSIREELRNKRIGKKRNQVERPYGFMKCVMNAGHVLVTTVDRVRVKVNMACLAYNVIHLRNLICGTKKQKKQSKAIKNSWGIAKNLQDLFAFF